MTKSTEPGQPMRQVGSRKKIGLVDTEPRNAQQKVEGLTPAQQALREAAINHFKTNKLKAFIAKQIEYVNSNRQIGEAIRFLFDEHGNPPVNAPLEEIIAEREKIENQIRWLEAVCSVLRTNLSRIKEIEELALELVDHGRNR
jgi:hypothetical protein